MATTLAIHGAKKPTPILKHRIGGLTAKEWTEINTGPAENKEKLLKYVRDAAKEPFPLGPYPFFHEKKGWLNMYMSDEFGPIPSLTIDNGFELQLSMPWVKYFRVKLEKEIWDSSAKQMVKTDDGAMFLNGLCPLLIMLCPLLHLFACCAPCSFGPTLNLCPSVCLLCPMFIWAHIKFVPTALKLGGIIKSEKHNLEGYHDWRFSCNTTTMCLQGC